MYQVKETEYGFRLTVSGVYSSEEIELSKRELIAIAKSKQSEFAAFIDARDHIAFASDEKDAMTECERVMKEYGCIRVAIILNSPVIMNQAKQISLNSGTSSIERYIDARKTDEWERIGLDWAVFGIEPPANVQVGLKNMA